MGAHHSRSDEPLSEICFDPEADRPHDECGVFGILAPGHDVPRLTYFGLFALQHRGQESAGIAVSDGCKLKLPMESHRWAPRRTSPTASTAKSSRRPTP